MFGGEAAVGERRAGQFPIAQPCSLIQVIIIPAFSPTPWSAMLDVASGDRSSSTGS